MTFDKPITVQVMNKDTEKWGDLLKLHTRVNKTGGGQTINAGADQFHATLTFEVRYSRALESIRFKPQFYRVVYRGHTFKVTDYDDYMEQHRTVRIVGELYE